MATPAKRTAPEPDKTPEPNLPDDAKHSQSASSGHGTAEQRDRAIASTGGPEQEEVSKPARAEADEGQKQGYIRVKYADQPEPKEQVITPGNEQPLLQAALDQGYHGEQVDETPNEHYTVSGVTAGKPTPENPDGRH